MKKIFIVYALLIIAVIILAVLRFGNFDLFASKKDLTLANQTFKVQIADSEDKRIKGLSGKRNLPEDEGMLFIFDKKERYAFWMKDMNFPIDIIYIEDDKVVDIKKNAQPLKDEESNPQTFKSSTPANYVLEINAGLADKYGIKNGDTITLPSE